MGVASDFEALLPSVSLVLVFESFPWPWDLFLACDWGKRLEIKGLAVGQAYFS
jgi:hypothetical protein